MSTQIELGFGIPADFSASEAIGVAGLSQRKWNLDMINFYSSTAHNFGAGVKIGIIDSGYTHQPQLVIPAETTSIGFKSGKDQNGHGTSVYSIISLIAKNSLIYNVKVLDENGFGKIEHTEEAIYYLIDKGVDVINMSLGAKGKHKGVVEALKKAEEAGIVIISASGNTGKSNVLFPANQDYPIAVGAINRKSMLASFSTTGKEIDIVAPGENVEVVFHDGSHRIASGTSFAAPHVTGIVALMIDSKFMNTEKKLRPELIKRNLYKNAEDLGIIGWDKSTGHGLAKCRFDGGKNKSKRGSKFENYMKWVARIFIFISKRHFYKEEKNRLENVEKNRL